MSTANAWLLNLGDAMHVAIGMRELVQIVEAPNTFSVPLAPPSSSKVMFWQKRLLPVLDLSIRLNQGASKGSLFAIVAYQECEGASAQLAAIVLTAPPVRIAVDDAQACVLEQDMACWRELANASFSREGEVIPVLHLRRVFGTAEIC